MPIKKGLIHNDIIADAKSGVTGAGRKAMLATQFSEVSETFMAYAVSGHRHRGARARRAASGCSQDTERQAEGQWAWTGAVSAAAQAGSDQARAQQRRAPMPVLWEHP